VVTVDDNPAGDPVQQHEGGTAAGNKQTGGEPGESAEPDQLDDAADGDDGDGDAWTEGESAELSDIDEDPEAAEAPDRFTRIRRSTAGAMLTGIGIGLQQIFETPRKEPAFVIKASSDPNGPQGPIDLHFDPDDPTKTVAIIRSQPTDRTPGLDPPSE
jgi:hypothetical protein